jgi:hypothetical protein
MQTMCTTSSVMQTDNSHQHTLVITAAVINSTMASMTFTTGVTNGHSHKFTVSAADFATLRTGGALTNVSTTVPDPAGHSHTYTVHC